MRAQIFTLLLASGITPVISAMEGQPQPPASINIPVAGHQTFQFPPFPAGTPITINLIAAPIANANPT